MLKENKHLRDKTVPRRLGYCKECGKYLSRHLCYPFDEGPEGERIYSCSSKCWLKKKPLGESYGRQ